MIAGSTADCYTTVEATKHGATEINPFMKPFSRNLGACMVIKSAFMLPLGFYGWKHDSIKGQLFMGSFGAGLAVINRVEW